MGHVLTIHLTGVDYASALDVFDRVVNEGQREAHRIGGALDAVYEKEAE